MCGGGGGVGIGGGGGSGKDSTIWIMLIGLSLTSDFLQRFIYQCDDTLHCSYTNLMI